MIIPLPWMLVVPPLVSPTVPASSELPDTVRVPLFVTLVAAVKVLELTVTLAPLSIVTEPIVTAAAPTTG